MLSSGGAVAANGGNGTCPNMRFTVISVNARALPAPRYLGR